MSETQTLRQILDSFYQAEADKIYLVFQMNGARYEWPFTDLLEAENAELKAELAAIKKTIQDKYKNVNEVLGLNLGGEK